MLGVARFQRLDLRGEHVAECVVDLLMDDHALHMDAALPRLVIAAEDDARERMVEVGVLVDDDRGVAAEFEHDLFLARLRLQVPADTQRRSEEHTSELQSLMRISYAVFSLKTKEKVPTRK